MSQEIKPMKKRSAKYKWMLVILSMCIYFSLQSTITQIHSNSVSTYGAYTQGTIPDSVQKTKIIYTHKELIIQWEDMGILSPRNGILQRCKLLLKYKEEMKLDELGKASLSRGYLNLGLKNICIYLINTKHYKIIIIVTIMSFHSTGNWG